MNNVDFSQFKCRASAIRRMMSNSRSNPPITEIQEQWIRDYEARQKPPTERQTDEYKRLLAVREASKEVILSDTCIEYLMEVYAWETEGMIAISKESMNILTLSKGKRGEGEAGNLLTQADGIEYKVHKERISNDFLTGEIDLYTGVSVYAADSVVDIKNAIDYPTFLKNITVRLENGHEDQLRGYGDITKAKELHVAHALISLSETEIIDKQWELARKLGCATTESPEFIAEWPKWERSMRFDHMPAKKRTHKIGIEPFSECERQKVYDRVKICRDWLCKFHEEREKMN